MKPLKMKKDLEKFLKHLKRDEKAKKEIGYFIVTAKVEREFRDQFAFWLQNQREYSNKYAVARECTFNKKKEITADIAIFEKQGITIKDKPLSIIELKSACLFDSVKKKKEKKHETQLKAFIKSLREDLVRWNGIATHKIGILLIQNVDLPQRNDKTDSLFRFVKYFKGYNSPTYKERLHQSSCSKIDNLKKFCIIDSLKGRCVFSKENDLPFYLRVYFTYLKSAPQ